MEQTRAPSHRRRLPGFEWRWLAWNPKTGEKHAGYYERAQGVCFDELVVDDWFHIEQMDARAWWIRIADADLWVYLPVKGPPELRIDRGVHDAPDTEAQA